MAFVAPVTGDDSTKKFLEVLQNDFKNLSLETKKKYPQIRESCDEAIEKLSLAANNPQASLYGVVNQILYPLVQGCESKDLKIIKFCLGTMQRLIAGRGVDARGARHIVDCLAALGAVGGLEPRLLQTAALLLTTSDLVRGDTLARTLVVCLRLQEAPGSAQHAAGATVRQLVSLVFERAANDCKGDNYRDLNPSDIKPAQNSKVPKELRPCAADAYLMFQDIVQLVNGDQPHWLVGITEISKTFGLELLETILTDFSQIFFKITEFRFLLKEHVCPLIIRLFSPNVKYRMGGAGGGGALVSAGAGGGQTSGSHPHHQLRPHFPLTCRLLRMLSSILHHYHSILVTECEIFLSLTIKFLDPDKPLWQRALALEVLHKIAIRPELLTSFCECYDLRPHATNIFQDIVNAIGAYLQSLFVASQVNTPVGMTGVPQQAGFFWKGVWLPMCVTFPPGTAKWTYLEMLDRTEAPQVQDGYGISVAYACIIEIVRSIALIVGGTEYLRDQDYEPPDLEIRINERNTELDIKKEDTQVSVVNTTEIEIKDGVYENEKTDIDEKEQKLHLQMVQSSWCGLVWGLSVLAEASIGELELVLRTIHTLARVSAKVGHTGARDACAGALCRAALPAHYPLAALGALPGPRAPSTPSVHPNASPPAQQEPHQVLCVGTPPPSNTPPPGQPGWVVVTGRQVAGLRALLRLAARHGSALQEAWLPVLTTIQHLVWILGLKPSTGGSLKAGRAHTDSHALMSTAAVMADLPMLSGLVSKVFESSAQLDPEALHYLLDALRKLSNEAMELAYSNREPSLFAVAKLLETGLANLHRVEVMWRPLTNHLLAVCQHPHIRMREWGVEAITYLVKSALHYKFKHPDQGSEKLESLLVEPLGSLSSIQHADVRQRQLECVSQLLHSHGQALAAAYPQLLHIVAAIAEHHSPVLVRSAFQCLQVVCTELVGGGGGGGCGAGGAQSLRRAAAAAARFARQSQDLNVSLTAVGLMWNISDYLYHNQERLAAILSEDTSVYPEFPGTVDLPQFEKLWMCLYIRLGELCTEGRPSVRRAACQTLFSCVGAHGGSLQPAAWRPLLWAVLFPMLHKVQNQANMASSEKVDTGEHILIHHSRNTAQKQWAESQVLTLSGVARVFHTKHQVLQGLGDFARAWAVLLDFIQNFALCQNHEVAVGALKSFQEVLLMKRCPDTILEREVCSLSWQVWVHIAREASSATNQRLEQADPPTSGVVTCVGGAQPPSGEYVPSQAFLTALVQIFPTIFQNIKSTFTAEDLSTLGNLLENIIVVSAHSPQTIVDTGSVSLLHSAVLHCLELLQQEALLRTELLPALFGALLGLSRIGSSPCGGRALTQAVRLYQACAPQRNLPNTLLLHIVEVLRECGLEGMGEGGAPLPALLQALEAGLPLAREDPKQYARFWGTLPSVLDGALFQARAEDERLCCELVGVIRVEILPYASKIPPPFLSEVVGLLNKGSIHTAFSADGEGEPEVTLREEFARTCFETLLQFSLLENVDNLTAENGEFAVTSLLERFGDAIRGYYQQAGALGGGEIPRSKLSEISFVLKAIATLVDSMKKAPKGKVDRKAWEKLIGLYPELVECAAVSGGSQVATPLKEALLLYADLLTPPL